VRSKGAQQDAASEAQVAQGQAGQESADGQDKKSDNKAERSESMDLESVAGSVTYASEQEREAARLERKKANAHRVRKRDFQATESEEQIVLRHRQCAHARRSSTP
jgi:hypothetical protein